MPALTKDELEEVLKELKNVRGRHTELVTVYIPADYNINTVARQIDDEKGTATNIKSKSTRKNVLDALETISRELKLYKQTPKNGMAIFCGNVSEKEGQTDIKLWVLEPPKSLNTRLYRCDQEFVLDPLEEMLEVDEVYGLVVMDRKEATIGLLEGKHIKLLRHLTSGVPGKYKTGGQSSQRFERLREEAAKEFYRRISENMKEVFFDNDKLKGIIVGGPVPTKEEFMEQAQLVTQLKEKVIGLKDIGNTDESGLEDLVEASQELLQEQEIIHEKQVLENFFESLGKSQDAIYGEEEVKKALKYGAVGTLILSKSLDRKKITELTKLAENISAEVEIVSTDTPEGEQFKNLKGIGALLRFHV